MTAAPSPPGRTPIPEGDPKSKLLGNVTNALRAVPAYFDSGTYIEGLEAGDVFNLNAVLGSSIEIQVVETLNRIRKVWDPDNEWPEHRFERSSQTFPDVRLVARSGGSASVVIGVELKGWYLLAKEGEPSFRYKVSPGACSAFDLVVVVPWHLKNVLSGVPIVYEPYIEQARYVAEFRNYWWQNIRESKADRTIKPGPEVTGPYPPPKSRVNDEAVRDGGHNFGRVARIGVMDAFVEELLGKRVSGVEARHWVLFFKTYAETADPDAITKRLTVELEKRIATESAELAERVDKIVQELLATLAGDA